MPTDKKSKKSYSWGPRASRNTEWRNCIDCSARFEVRYGYETRCWECYKEYSAKHSNHQRYNYDPSCGARQRRYTSSFNNDAEIIRLLRVDLMRAKREITLLTGMLESERRNRPRRDKTDFFNSFDSFVSGGKKPQVPQEKIQQLIRLCHPDKHQNSELATELTRWLLDMRKRK